jgi:two-component system, OmpR family, sensor histidine kinase KdpD
VRTLTRVAASAGALALVTGAIELLKGHVPVLSLAVLYLLAIIPVAVAWGIVYAVGTAIGSMLAFNFFFVEPLYTFTIEDTKNWFALLVFLVTAVVVSELATRSRRRAEEAEEALAALRKLTEERERLAGEALEAEALRRSDALKTALLRAVSHDLRSPLTAILASADALASPSLSLEPEDRLALAETIRSEATRLDRVVEQLLDLSRLEAGAAEPHRELWHVDELVGQALAGLGAEAGRVRLDIGSETPPVEVDAAQIERVLANLLENALRYSPPGSQVLLRVERGATELRIHVIDTGAGLPDEQREALFQPFRRGAAGQGSGLGLAIARGFAEANGGRLWAQNDPGGGHLVLSLPLAERPAAVPV